MFEATRDQQFACNSVFELIFCGVILWPYRTRFGWRLQSVGRSVPVFKWLGSPQLPRTMHRPVLKQCWPTYVHLRPQSLRHRDDPPPPVHMRPNGPDFLTPPPPCGRIQAAGPMGVNHGGDASPPQISARGPFKYYVTLFWPTLTPPPCHRLSHRTDPPPPVT